LISTSAATRSGYVAANRIAASPDSPAASAASERFRELWARADVGYRLGVLHMRHPVVGDLYLRRNRFNIPHSGGQHMLTYRADPGSGSAKALDVLRSLG
jgi:MmyB-like transcription regulator ligand binding domain